MLDLWAALSPLSPQYMYVTVPEAVQCGIFGTANSDEPEWPRANTLYQIAQLVNRVGDYDPQLLKGCPRLEAGPMPPRAGNVSMDSGKLRCLLGTDPFRPWPVGEELFPTGRHWHFDRLPGERGSAHSLVERLYQYASAGRARLTGSG